MLSIPSSVRKAADIEPGSGHITKKPNNNNHIHLDAPVSVNILKKKLLPLLALARSSKLIFISYSLAERDELLLSWLNEPMATRLKS